MRRFAAIPLLVLVLVACANDPTPAPAGDGSPEPTLDQTRLGIYEAMIRELAGAEDLGPGFDWNRIVVVTRLCENAGEPAKPKGCDDALSVDEQAALESRLGDLGPPVKFMADPTPLYDEDWLDGTRRDVVVRLGTITRSGDGASVGGSYGCGGLCGSGTTYLLEPRGERWEVVGTTGTAWIA